jgi:hypothetical protein
MTEYHSAFPESPRADDLKHALEETAPWQAAVRWGEKTRGWRGRATVVEPREATARADQCRRFLETHPNAPDAAMVRDYLAVAEAVVRREEGDGGGARQRLERLFSDILIADVWHVRTKSAENYYIPDSTEAPRESVQLRSTDSGVPDSISYFVFKYLSSFDGKNQTKRVPQGEVARNEPAPQSVIANEVKRQLRSIRPEDWEETMIAIATRIRNDPEIDPILQLILLGRVFELASSGSHALEISFQQQRQTIESANVDLSVPWMDPENLDAIRLRPRAKALLERLPSPDASAEAAREEMARVDKAIAKSRQWVGWLIKDGKGTWTIRFRGSVEEGDSLWVVAPGLKDTNDWKGIGTFEDGTGNLARGAQAVLLEGRPVFAHRDQAPPLQ